MASSYGTLCTMVQTEHRGTQAVRHAVHIGKAAAGKRSRGRVAMARCLRSLTRLARGVFRHPAPLRHAAPRLAAQSPSPFLSSLRFMSDDHTAKWMQNTEKRSPMQLIDEVAPIKVDARVVACEGGTDPALGHPTEYISLDGAEPAVCKYCGLRYYQGDAHGHH